jgi:hypothetical protein
MFSNLLNTISGSLRGGFFIRHSVFAVFEYSSQHRHYERSVGLVGRAIDQAVSRRHPTAAARVRDHDVSCGICDGQNGTGAGFLRVLRFSLPIVIPPTAPRST